MLTETLITLFKRDLTALKQEVNLYKDEKKIWLVSKDIINSPGNLCLHLVGNLNHFIGATIGNTGYIRKRDLEFSLKDVPKSELIKQVDETIEMISRVLKSLTEDDLQKDYPLKVFKDYGVMNTAFFLTHLAMHLSYHLGQINYHRRLLDN